MIIINPGWVYKVAQTNFEVRTTTSALCKGFKRPQVCRSNCVLFDLIASCFVGLNAHGVKLHIWDVKM